jgi:hypothetical protein
MKSKLLIWAKRAMNKQQMPPKLPRHVKYAWGVAMTLLLFASLTLERGSVLMPLVNSAIDLLQQQQQQQN